MLGFRMCVTVTLFAALCSIPSTLLAQVKPEVDAGLTAYQSTGGTVAGKLAMGTSETMRRLRVGPSTNMRWTSISTRSDEQSSQIRRACDIS